MLLKKPKVISHFFASSVSKTLMFHIVYLQKVGEANEVQLLQSFSLMTNTLVALALTVTEKLTFKFFDLEKVGNGSIFTMITFIDEYKNLKQNR